MLISLYRAYRTPPTLGRSLCSCPGNGRRDLFFFSPTLTPLRTLNAQDAHHDTRPAILHALRSVTH